VAQWGVITTTSNGRFLGSISLPYKSLIMDSFHLGRKDNHSWELLVQVSQGDMVARGKLAQFFGGSCVARENWPSSRRTMCFPTQACPSSLWKHGCLRQMGSSSKRTMSFLGPNGFKFLENHPFALGNTLFLRELELKTWFSAQLGWVLPRVSTSSPSPQGICNSRAISLNNFPRGYIFPPNVS
jgi:hypothetical protein